MTDKWMSIPQMARELKAVEQTIRRYIDRFKEFFTCEIEGGVTLYEPKSLDILKQIQELYSQKRKKDEIREILGKELQGKIPAPGLTEKPQGKMAATELYPVLEGIKNTLESLVNEVRELKEVIKSKQAL